MSCIKWDVLNGNDAIKKKQGWNEEIHFLFAYTTKCMTLSVSHLKMISIRNCYFITNWLDE